MPQNTSISVRYLPPLCVGYPILPSSVGVGGGGIEAHVGPPGHPVSPIMWVPLAILWPLSCGSPWPSCGPDYLWS